jgi:hypothetical protein
MDIVGIGMCRLYSYSLKPPRRGISQPLVPVREVQDTLGISEQSFYRYLSQAFEHDRQLLLEQDKNNLALELRALHDRLTNAYRRLVLIASNEEEDIYQLRIDRINADIAAAACEVALAIVKLAFEGPIVLKDFASYLR